VHSRKVQERIRLGGRNEACTVREANAREPRIQREAVRKAPRPAVSARYPPHPLLVDAVSPEPREAHSETARKPSICSSRESGSTGHRAWRRSTACSAGPASSRTYSPQIASPTSQQSTQRRVGSCAWSSFDSKWIRRLSQRKDTEQMAPIACASESWMEGPDLFV
jgi:hypothetical protein